MDKSDSNDENENSKRDDNEHAAMGNNSGGAPPPCWAGFNGSAGVTGHLAGLLAQNGQNGGSNVSF